MVVKSQLVLIAAKTSLVPALACPSSSIMLCILFLIRLCIKACKTLQHWFVLVADLADSQICSV